MDSIDNLEKLINKIIEDYENNKWLADIILRRVKND